MNNEQRAHDLAMFHMSKLAELNLSNLLNSSAEHIGQTPEPFKLNFYADYKNAYDAAIDALNTDYPDGK